MNFALDKIAALAYNSEYIELTSLAAVEEKTEAKAF